MRRSTRKAILLVLSLLLNATLVAAVASFAGFMIGKQAGFRNGIIMALPDAKSGPVMEVEVSLEEILTFQELVGGNDVERIR